LVYCIERLRLADDVPVAHHKVYLRITDFGPDFLNDDFTGSIYAIYHRYQKRLIWANEIIQARSANEKEIQLFNLMALPTFQRIVYLRDRITYNEENIGTEVLESVERSDFFKSYQYRLMIEET
jgi:DNA-binding GntR family transcriptional regulator